MMRKRHLQREIDSIERQYHLLGEKIDRLRYALALETGAAEKFRLEHELAREEQQLNQLAQQLGVLERLLASKVIDNLPVSSRKPIGREREHRRVRDALAEFALVAIEGIGGAGKTWLARDIARVLVDEYDAQPRALQFEAIVWASTWRNSPPWQKRAEQSPPVRDVWGLCDTIARVLHFDAILPAEPQQRVAAVRQAVAQQRTLLIVDDLDTLEDTDMLEFVRSLPQGARVLITSRQRPAHTYHVGLSGMPWDEARSLIDQLCSLESVSLAETQRQILYERTDGVPLALVRCLEQVGAGLDLEKATAEAASPQGEIARYCLEPAFVHIRGSSAHWLLVALALLAPRCGREILGHVAGVADAAERDQGIAALEHHTLIQREGDQFGMLPMTRRYALEELMDSSSQQFAAIIERALVAQQLLDHL